MDQATLKAKELGRWTTVMPGWRKHDAQLVRAWDVVSERVLDAAGVGPGARVLDVASGTVGPTGRVLGVDFVEPMLEFAREKAAALGLTNLELRRVDGEALDVPDASFDAVTIRWGLMFMPDPGACLARAHRALRPGGRISLACWAGPELNPWVTVAMAAVGRHLELPTPPPGAPGIFAFADRARLVATIEAAGFHDVRVEPLEGVGLDFATGADYFTFTSEIAGPLAGLLAQLDPAKQAIVAREIAADAEKASKVLGRVVLPGVTWVAWGTK